MYCKNCGKEIHDNTVICPHCGVQVGNLSFTQTTPERPIQEDNSIAVVGLILAFFVPIAGLICSILGYNKAKRLHLENRGVATAGIILSAVILALQTVAVVVYLFWFFSWSVLWRSLLYQTVLPL